MAGPIGPTGPTGFDIANLLADGVLTQEELLDTIGQANPEGGALAGLDRSRRVALILLTKMWDQSSNDLEEAINNAREADFELIRNIFSALLLEAESFAELNLLIIEATRGWEEVAGAHNNEINGINGNIDGLNQNTTDNAGIDSSETEALNQAIRDYNTAKNTRDDVFNDPQSTQQEKDDAQADLDQAILDYNAAATTYNNYASGRNVDISGYNSNVTNYNQTLEGNGPGSATKLNESNAERASFGLGTLDPNEVRVDANGDPVLLPEAPELPELQGGGDPPSMVNQGNPPASITELPSTPAIQSFNQGTLENIITPDSSEALSATYARIIGQMAAGFSNIRDLFDRIALQIELEFLFGFGSNRITLQDIYNRDPDFLTSDPTGPGSSAAMGTYELSFREPASLDRILGNALFQSLLKEFGVQLPVSFFNELQFIIIGLLFNTGLLSAFPAARLVRDNNGPLGAGSSSIGVAQDLIAIRNLTKIVTSGQVEDLVQKLLEKELQGEGTISPTAVNQLVKSLSAVFKLALLGSGLVNLALSLGLPGLIPQILANVSGLSAGEAKLATSVGGSQIRAVLENPLSVLELENAIPGINLAILNIDEKIGQLNFEEFKAALSGQLQALGLSPAEADAQAALALAIIRANLPGMPLDVAIREDLDINSIINIVKEQAVGIGEDGDKLKEEVRRLIEEQEFDSIRELRQALFNLFLQAGLAVSNAFFIGNQVANLVAGGAVGPTSGISAGRLRELRSLLQNEELVDKALGQGPFANEAEFLFVLRNEFAIAGLASEFDNAVAGFATGGGSITVPGLGNIISLGAIATELQQEIVKRVSGEIGEDNAKALANEVIAALFGAISPNQIGNAERRDPQSVLNLVEDSIREIVKREDIQLSNNVHDDLIDYLRTLIKPSAEQGFVIKRSISDGPTSMISNLAAGGAAEKLGDTLMKG